MKYQFVLIDSVSDPCDGSGLSPGERTYSAADAFAVIMNERGVGEDGAVDMLSICKLTGLPPETVSDALGDIIFQDPELFEAGNGEYEGWVLAATYLTGPLLKKLRCAQEADKKYGRFAKNIIALQRALPEKVRLDEIYCGIGSVFIPGNFYARFADSIMKVSGNTVYWSEPEGMYKLGQCPWRRSLLASFGYGTLSHGFYDIFEKMLNGKPLAAMDHYTDSAGKVHTRLDKAETEVMIQKAAEIRGKFGDFCRDHALEIEEFYYKWLASYGASRPELYPADFLQLPGLNPAVEPWEHQKRGVLRGLLQKNLLLNHDTGTGKTDAMIECATELLRLGLTQKILTVVPNQVLAGFTARHRYLYPDADFMCIAPRDMTPKNREAILQRAMAMSNGLIYMAASVFDRFHVSDEYRISLLDSEIRSLELEKNALRSRSEGNRRELNAAYDAAIARKRAEKRKLLEKQHRAAEAADQHKTEVSFSFEKLNITTLIVDEAHHYKNVGTPCSTTSVVGMSRNGSRKCDSMLEKVRYVQSRGRGVIFATGTPMTNSIADIYTLQRYLQPETLRFLRLESFDAWINTFGEKDSELEIDVDSSGYRVKERVGGFHNLTELAALFSEVCDHYHPQREELSAARKIVTVQASPEQKAYIKGLAKRTDSLRQGRKENQKDNLLRIVYEGRAAALDLRLLNPKAYSIACYSKLEACAREIAVRYRENDKNTQLVFCDLGTPKAGFNMYDALRDLLEDFGVPSGEVKFIHEARTDKQRTALFERFNKAEIRVLIGSTQLLGEGVNVQAHLRAVHHLDLPWRASDMIQRVGRMCREGNNAPARDELFYVTEGTFDSYNLQLLQNKQRGIDELLTATCRLRTLGDIGDELLSYAEIKALCVGNPLLKERIGLELEHRRLCAAKGKQTETVKELRAVLAGMPQEEAEVRLHISNAKADSTLFGQERIKMDAAPKMLRAMGVELNGKLRACADRNEETELDEFCGFKVIVPAHMSPAKPAVWLQGNERYYVELNGESDGRGHYTKLLNCLEKLPDRVRALQERLVQLAKDADEVREQLKHNVDYDAELSRVRARLIEIDEKLGLKKGA